MKRPADHPAPAHADVDTTIVKVVYPAQKGRVSLRGNGAGLDWFNDTNPIDVDGDVSTFQLHIPHFDPVQVKAVRDDGRFMVGRNAVIGRGDTTALRPSFEHEAGQLGGLYEVPLPWASTLTHEHDARSLYVRVRLPPSYSEQTALRYPVLYCQDGQSVWSDGTDPFGTWRLDHALNDLEDLGAIDEFIVVSIDTGIDRIHRLSPCADARFGGGGGAEHLRAMVDALKPHVDSAYRTRPGRASTVLLGSSMGGLFSFWAAWTRPDVIGGAICLSSSFWWSDRAMLKHVSGVSCPAPRPNLYLDCGAAQSGFEDDASTRDGVHNTRALYRSLREHCYGPGTDLFSVSWPGHHHNAESWAARIATPLQLFFPRSL